VTGKKWIGYARLLAEVPSTSCEMYKLPGCLWILVLGLWSPGPLFIPTRVSAGLLFWVAIWEQILHYVQDPCEGRGKHQHLTRAQNQSK